MPAGWRPATIAQGGSAMIKSFVTPVFLMTLALTPTPALAQAAAGNSPANNYECTNNAGTTVNYSTTSFTGDARLTVVFDGNVVSRAGEEIQTQRTVLGTLVTVVRSLVPDSFIDTITFLAPDVNVTAKTPEVSFKTEVFFTRTRTSIGGPSLVGGVVQSSTSRALVCTASRLDF
jgi:uncharacterized protein YdeI (BOF family)